MSARKPRNDRKTPEVRQQTASEIKMLREALGMSQSEFATHLTLRGMDKGVITGLWAVINWEHGKREPDLAHRQIIDEVRSIVERQRGTTVGRD